MININEKKPEGEDSEKKELTPEEMLQEALGGRPKEIRMLMRKNHLTLSLVC